MKNINRFSKEYYSLVNEYKHAHKIGIKKNNFHLSENITFDGKSLAPWIVHIKKIIDFTGSTSILDYGCGKAQHHPENWNAYKYDPAYPIYEKKPEAGRKFDLVICIDVLEHILEDKKELQRATFYLKPGGHLIILSPAFQFLYSPFDKAIGHYRRYTIKSLTDISPLNCQVVKSNYLDSIGCLASLVNKLFLRSSNPSISQINFWDKKIIPLSYFFDKLFLNSFGRSLYFVWNKSC